MLLVFFFLCIAAVTMCEIRRKKRPNDCFLPELGGSFQILLFLFLLSWKFCKHQLFSLSVADACSSVHPAHRRLIFRVSLSKRVSNSSDFQKGVVAFMFVLLIVIDSTVSGIIAPAS